MCMEFPLGVMEMFWNWTEVVVAQYCECTKSFILFCVCVWCFLFKNFLFYIGV